MRERARLLLPVLGVLVAAWIGASIHLEPNEDQWFVVELTGGDIRPRVTITAVHAGGRRELLHDARAERDIGPVVSQVIDQSRLGYRRVEVLCDADARWRYAVQAACGAADALDVRKVTVGQRSLAARIPWPPTSQAREPRTVELAHNPSGVVWVLIGGHPVELAASADAPLEAEALAQLHRVLTRHRSGPGVTFHVPEPDALYIPTRLVLPVLSACANVAPVAVVR